MIPTSDAGSIPNTIRYMDGEHAKQAYVNQTLGPILFNIFGRFNEPGPNLGVAERGDSQDASS